jgi:uncharacterized membrane protein
MKKLFFLIILIFQSGLSFSQMQGQRSGQGQGQASMPAFNAKNIAGILKYDEDKVFKKLGIKEDAMKQKIKKPFSVYHKKIDEILFLNNPKLEKVENKVNAQREIAMANKDRQAMMGIMDEARKELASIKKEVIEANKILNQQLEKILTEKQYKKWLKYQANKKKSLKPKSPSETNNMSRGQGQGRHGGGRGKMGY